MSVQFSHVDTFALPDHQRAFQLDSGETFVVEITSPVVGAAEAAHVISLCTRCWQVDDGGKPIRLGDSATEIPSFTRTIPLAALAEGLCTVEQAQAEETSKAAERFRNHLTALRAWQRIPRTPST